MKKSSFFFEIAAGFVLTGALAFPLLADAPAQISYQGKLTDNNGTPLSDGDKVLIFKVFDAYGVKIGADISLTTATKNGVFSAVVPIPESTFQTGTERYLELTYDGNAFSPRQKLVAAPYALAVAENAVGTLEIIDNAVTEAKIADNAVLSAQIKDGEVKAIDLADDAVTEAKIADNAVLSAQIKDGEIKTNDIANGVVTKDKIAKTPVYQDAAGNLTLTVTGAIVGYMVAP
jgi:hypothetical protein